MATISSPGVGSQLDVKSIVTQLVALEKRPLDGLKLQAATVQTKVSAFGQIKSLVSALAICRNSAIMARWTLTNASRPLDTLALLDSCSRRSNVSMRCSTPSGLRRRRRRSVEAL